MAIYHLCVYVHSGILMGGVITVMNLCKIDVLKTGGSLEVTVKLKVTNDPKIPIFVF